LTVRDFTTDDGVRLVYDDLGPADGRPIVLCHGLAAAALQFAADADYFAGLGYRLLVPDLRGHGRSGSPDPMRGDGFSIEQLAADMLAMLDHAGVERVHWVGNSLGGIVALAMLKHNRLATLATFGTVYALRLPRIGGHHLVTASRTLLGQNFLAALTARATSHDPAARKLIETVLRQARPDVTAMLAGLLTSYDLIAEAQAAAIPILLLRAGRDRAVSAGLGRTLRAMRGRPNFTLVELSDGGHCANLDARDAFHRALLRFWQANHRDANPAPER
jgi:pimeloyl-ACP methyl ester carboxylesterase